MELIKAVFNAVSYLGGLFAFALFAGAVIKAFRTEEDE